GSDRAGRGGRGSGYDGKGRPKSDYCRYYNAKTQICTNDPCRFIHDLNHVPEDTRGVRASGSGRSYSSFDRDSRDHRSDRGDRGDRRSDRRERDSDRRDRDSDRGERSSRRSDHRESRDSGSGGGGDKAD
ncbi:unnamed protein product, partial [Scytosiphon promiscuus]